MKRLYLFTLLYLVALSSLLCNAVEQRSKEADCLIVGYQNCLINNNYSNVSRLASTNTLKNSAADCWRISRTADNHHITTCGDNECLWDGGCVSNVVNEKDGNLVSEVHYSGYHTTENLPISAFYDDAHTITISFPTYLYTALYVLESRPLAADDQHELPWAFAGVSNETSISYRILDICHKYEFRPTAILNNGTVISFLPKVPTANPPDFIVDTLKLDKLFYDETEHKAVAVYTWKTPYGYTNNDVVSYDNYLHPIQCDITGDYVVTKKLVKTDDGGTFRIEFPENMIQRKCRFLVNVWATNVCNAKTAADAQADLELSCSRIDGYKCPESELKPKCMTRIVTSATSYDSSSNQVSVNISWLASGANVPEYYHVKWGPAELVDVQRRPPAPPPPSSDFGRTNNIATGRDFRPQPPPPPPPPPPRGPNFDLSVWMLKKDLIHNEKVDGSSTKITLNNLNLNENYGLQVCAIYNADFKTPEWPVVPVSGFTCMCNAPGCSSEHSIQCKDPDLFKLDKENPQGTTSTITPKPKLVVVPSHSGISPPPSSIGQVQDFTQSLVGWEYSGLRMLLNWNPPVDVSSEQMADYIVSLESLTDCNGTEICCNFAKFPDLKQTAKNSSQISLLVPKNVLRANCQFMVKIISVAINSAQSISLKNIVVPKPIADHDLDEAKTVSASGATANSPAFVDEKSGNLDLVQHEFAPLNTAVIERMNNNCTFMECSHSCNESQCLCPSNFTLLFDNKTCVEMSLNISTLLSRCQQLGCQYWCNDKEECVCPQGMHLAQNGKTCVYIDPDHIDLTAPPPLPTTPFDIGFWCLQEDNQITVVQQPSREVYLSWSNQSWVNERAFKNLKSPIIVRWGEIKTIPFMNLHKLITNETSMTLSDISKNKLLVGRINSSKKYGFQFCIFENDNAIGKVDWKLPPVLLLFAEKTIQDGSLKNVQSSSVVNKDDADANSLNVKKLIVISVVIPLCCLIIVISLVLLLCHFYPRPFRTLTDRLCSMRLFRRPSSSNSSTANCQGDCKLSGNECVKHKVVFNGSVSEMSKSKGSVSSQQVPESYYERNNSSKFADSNPI